MKILIADDDRVTRALLSRWVSRWGYETVVAENGTAALETLLENEDIQICVLDWMMPGMNGPEVCRTLRERRSEPYVYTTLLTSKTETDDVVEGLQSGADDYISKPCHPLELEVRLRVGHRLVELQRKLIAAREQLRFEATHDSLTQLLNRRAMQETLKAQFSSCTQANLPIAVVMMDIDHFKSINDNHGHHAGDAVLREMGERLPRLLCGEHAAARFGGEEFLLVLPDCNSGYAIEIAENVRVTVEAEPVKVGKLGVPVTASFGVAGIDQFRNCSADVLVRAADAALYRSKQAGRNRVTVAQPAEFTRPSMSAAGSAA